MAWPVNRGEEALQGRGVGWLGTTAPPIESPVDPTSSTIIIAPQSKATTTNPKDLLGVKKPSLSKIPPISLIWESLAMMDGGGKYGPYNWRAKDVVASIYVDAAKRHLDAWFEGQRCASDSGVHHLGHAKACCGILLDAEANGHLVDDRPVHDGGKTTDNYLAVLDEAMGIIKKMQESHKEFHAKQAATQK